MMADQYTPHATLTGEADVYRSARTDSASSIVFTDPELELVTPELGQQVQIQGELLKHWLRQRAQVFILKSIFQPDQGEADFDRVVEEVYKPELIEQQKERFEANIYVAKEHIPQLQARLERAGNAMNIADDEVTTALEQLKADHPHPYYATNMKEILKKAKQRKEDVDNLQADIVNAHLMGRTHESMLVHLHQLSRDIDTEPELRAEFDTLTLEARILAIEEAITILDDKLAVELESEKRDRIKQQKDALVHELSLYGSEEDEVQAPQEVERPVQEVMHTERKLTILSAIGARSVRFWQVLNFR